MTGSSAWSLPNTPTGQHICVDPFDLYTSLFIEKKLELIPVSFFELEQISLAIISLENGNIGRAIIEY